MFMNMQFYINTYCTHTYTGVLTFYVCIYSKTITCLSMRKTFICICHALLLLHKHVYLACLYMLRKFKKFYLLSKTVHSLMNTDVLAGCNLKYTHSATTYDSVLCCSDNVKKANFS